MDVGDYFGGRGFEVVMGDGVVVVFYFLFPGGAKFRETN